MFLTIKLNCQCAFEVLSDDCLVNLIVLAVFMAARLIMYTGLFTGSCSCTLNSNYNIVSRQYTDKD